MARSRIFEEFAKVACQYPSKIAIFFKKAGEYNTLTYSELYDKAVKLGNFLYTNINIREGDHVALILGNQPYWPISFMAIQYIGAVAVPLDAKLNYSNINQIIKHSQAKIILCSEKLHAQIKTLLSDEYQGIGFLKVDSPDVFGNLGPLPLNAEEKVGEKSRDLTAAMFYTSGTTDFPKGVLLSQNNLLSNVESIKQLGISSQRDVFISILPLHHTYAFMVTCLLPLLSGAAISYPSGMASEEILNCLKDTRVSVMVGVPQLFSVFHRVISEKIAKQAPLLKSILGLLIEILWWIRKTFGINLSKEAFFKIHKNFGRRLRYMITGGANLEPQVMRDLFKWGFTVLEGYGLTETSPVVTINLMTKLRIGSVGKPLPEVEVQISSPDQQGVGEILIKGPNVMQGYYNLAQETRKAIRDGWFHSGDFGSLDKEGYLYVIGRKDELIVLDSGEKVSPDEIERHYETSPYIKEVCVFKSKINDSPDESKKLMAVVVPNEELLSKAGSASMEEIIKEELNKLSAHLISSKRINGFNICRDALPRTALGKIMRYKVESECLPSITNPRKSAADLETSSASSSLSEIDQRLLKYLSARFKKEISLEDHLELDLGLDSLDRVELLLELQKHINVEIPESETMQFFSPSTVGGLLQKLKPFLPEKPANHNSTD